MGPEVEVGVPLYDHSQQVHRRHAQGPGSGPTPMAPGPTFGPGPGGGGMPFMSFDLGASYSSAFAPPPRASGAGFETFDEEPPLLEELGINLPLIGRKIYSVLHPLRLKEAGELMEDGDLSGPILFCVLLGTCQLLAGKIHFGVVLGWTTLASIALYGLFNMLASPSGKLDLYRCTSIVGYGLLPILCLSAGTLLVPPKGIASMLFAAVAVLWSARTCSALFVALVPQAEESRSLVAYACMLVYATFALLIAF